MSVVSEGVLFSALQPNSSTVSTYAVPSDNQLGHGGPISDEAARSRRVQQQVALRLAEKSTLPRRTAASTSQYASSDHGGSSTMTKYQTYNPNFSSKSYMYATARPVMANHTSQHSSSGYSSRSAMDFGARAQMSQRPSVTMMYNHDDMGNIGRMGSMGGMGGMVGKGGVVGGYQGGQSQHYQMTTLNRSMGHGVPDPETTSIHSLRMQSLSRQQAGAVGPWMTRSGSEGSLGSDQDPAYARQDAAYSMSNGYSSTFPHQNMFSTTSNEFATGVSQTAATLPAMRHSFSSSASRNGGNGFNEAEAMYVRQGFKGPSQRTISRITQNRQYRNSVSAGSMQGGVAGGTFSGAGSQTNLTLMKGRMSRAPSMRSVVSVGRGKDVFDGVDITGSLGNLAGINSLDLTTAVNYLDTKDIGQQILGAAFIQHDCYHKKESRKAVRDMKGIVPLVALFNSESDEVQRYSTGAARNLIYENMENKVALIEAGGIPKLMVALNEPDDDLQKNITGILWNLSSKDSLKEKLAREILPNLTADVLIPLSGTGEREVFEHNPSEEDIFLNTTGCLRNLSSINALTRKQMRENPGLVDALVGYASKSLEDSRVEEKAMENVVCVLRNLSYQLYDEIPPSASLRLEGSARANATSRGEPIGCFTPQSKKAKDRQNQDLTTFTEVAKVPKGIEWLWHPKVVDLYHSVLQRCESNSTTREAAAGALQNITAGEKRWASILSRVALEQRRILPVILDRLNTTNDLEQRSLTGFLRNLSRHARDKNDLASKVVSHLVTILPTDGTQNLPSPDVVLNICGALNNLVTCSELAARDIAYFEGMPKLIGIKTSHDNSLAKTKQSKAAATVLSNMFQYKKLHKEYKKRGFHREDFANLNF